MLAAQMPKSADQAMAAIPVIITAARPVAIVGKILEHEIEQLHRLCDLGFQHDLIAPDGRSLSPAAAIRIAACLWQNNLSHRRTLQGAQQQVRSGHSLEGDGFELPVPLTEARDIFGPGCTI